MTAAKSAAYRFRCIILVIGILFTLAGVVWMVLPYLTDEDVFLGVIGTPFIFLLGEDGGEGLYAVNLAILFGIMLLTQWMFLRPGKHFKVNLAEQGRPLKTSVFAAALMSTLLTVGVIALLLEIPDWWKAVYVDPEECYNLHLWVYLIMLIIWAGWAVVFFVYWKQGDRYTQLGKMIRGLVAGSILEIMVAVPVHVWATRQRDCYCCRGTYTTLVFAGTVLIWVFGPGIILLYMREKYRRAKLLEGVHEDKLPEREQA